MLLSGIVLLNGNYFLKLGDIIKILYWLEEF